VPGAPVEIDDKDGAPNAVALRNTRMRAPVPKYS